MTSGRTCCISNPAMVLVGISLFTWTSLRCRSWRSECLVQPLPGSLVSHSSLSFCTYSPFPNCWAKIRVFLIECFKRELLINFFLLFYALWFLHHPHQLVNHAKAEHFISQNMFAHGHFCSKLVLSIYTGKSWPKVFKVPKVRVWINYFSEFSREVGLTLRTVDWKLLLN